ncbi:MAG TPA: 2'-5' RNA ligase family protein [Chloroflexi bacterium]|nr:2'-5' RNA ligase family protein [Chloroflexota bacterium]
MKVAIAFLLDHKIHNFMRSLAVDIHRQYPLGFSAASALPHISLKQPFPIADLAEVEAYFEQLAASIPPFKVELTRLELQTYAGQSRGIAPTKKAEWGILWLAVRENPVLRNLHRRINRELGERFENTRAAFDGEAYRFHATLFTGEQNADLYREAFAAYKDTPINLSCTIKQIALFYKNNDSADVRDFITYKILPLK